MKHTVLLYFIVFIFLTQCFTTHTDHSYSPQTHIFFIPQQITHPLSTHLSAHSSINTTMQKKYHPNYLTPTQQLKIINNWIERYLKTNSTPCVQQPSIPQKKQTPPSTCCKDTKNISQPIEAPLPEKIAYIAVLETALCAERLCPEWEKHAAILDTRNSAIEQIKNGNNAITTQYHKISHKMQNYCNAHDINPDILMQSSGTAMQHTIHQEFVTITKKSSKFWHTSGLPKPLHKMTHMIADFTYAGIAYNNNNQAHQAIHLANACWIILDCIQAAGEGLFDGTYHIVDDIMHPVRTAQNIIESAAVCGYYIGKVAIEIGQFGYLAIVEPPDRAHEKLNVWKQNFSLIYEAIQKKRSTLKTRDIIKESVSFGVQCYASPKVLHGLGTLFKHAHKQVIIFANNIPALKKTNALTTPEGIIVRIAENTTECMKNEFANSAKHINTVRRLTQKEISDIANRLNFKKTNYYSHGQPIFKKRSLYISYDTDCHNGGIWKMANSVENLKSKRTRMGTYDMNLNRIGD